MIRRHDITNEADRHVLCLHALARGVLVGEVFDLLVQHGRVVHQVDDEVEAVVNAQQVRSPLGTVRLVDLDAIEQSLRLRVTLEHSAPVSRAHAPLPPCTKGSSSLGVRSPSFKTRRNYPRYHYDNLWFV